MQVLYKLPALLNGMFPHYNHRNSQPDPIVGQLKFTSSRLTYTLLSSPQ